MERHRGRSPTSVGVGVSTTRIKSNFAQACGGGKVSPAGSVGASAYFRMQRSPLETRTHRPTDCAIYIVLIEILRSAQNDRFLYEIGNQNNPEILPSASTSILDAAGTFGSPGIVIMSPVSATTKPAPAERRTSRTVSVKPSGLPSSAVQRGFFRTLIM